MPPEHPSDSSEPDRRPLLVLSLDGLAPASLGCYGSSWNRTPSIDRVASRGAVWDRAIAATTSPQDVLRSWFQRRSNVAWQDPFRSFGSVNLLTDDPVIAEPATSGTFDQAVLVDEPPTTASGIEESQFGRLIAAAIERHQAVDDWSVLWLHSRFLTHRWDAPRDLASWDMWDEEEDWSPEEDDGSIDDEAAQQIETPLPPVFEQTRPPRVQLSEDVHPDLVTSWMRTYGCQVRLVDLLLKVLLDAIQPLDPVVAVLGTSGFSLGQNGWIGHRCGPLRSCHLRLPMIIGHGDPIRSPKVTASTRLPALLTTLLDPSTTLVPADTWAKSDEEFEPAVTSGVPAEESPAGQGTPGAVTTPRWFYTRDSRSEEALFLKPDDADDVNDVSRLKRETVEQLQSMLGP